MKKSKLKPSLEEAFGVGAIEGRKETLAELQEMISEGASLETLKIYLKSAINLLNLHTINNPFKKKD